MGMSELDRLLREALRRPMTEAEKEEQARSFAYGNCAIGNPHVTREMVDEAAERLKGTPDDDEEPIAGEIIGR